MPVLRPPADNITMVAYHGGKDSRHDLTELVGVTTEKIRGVVAELGLPGRFFKAYQDYQIHATIIGMEVLKIGNELFNANFLNNNGVLRTIDPRGLLALLEAISRSRDQRPLFTIRFGGFRKSYCKCRGFDLLDWACVSGDSEFHSFERSAYEGSFYAFRGGPVVLTGWPIPDLGRIATFTRDLFGFRRAASEFGFLDKYHLDEKPHWKDDDFYIRLGTLGECPTPEFESLVEKMRDFLGLKNPTMLEVGIDDLSIVHYAHPTLDQIKHKISVADAMRNPDLVADLYAQWSAEH